jgi:hypothetical protein
MYWYYVRQGEDDYLIRYEYARGSMEVSGVIGYIKAMDETIMLKPAQMDSCEFNVSAAISHFSFVRKEGFPESRLVACG